MNQFRCPSCGRDNAPDARFCRFCGRPLPTVLSPDHMRRELQQLRDLLTNVTARVNSLEQALLSGTTEPAAPEEPQIPEIPQSIEPAPIAGVEPVTETMQPAQEPEPVEPVPVIEELPETAVPLWEEPVVEKQPREWEQILGGSWLARIGVLAIIIGVGFFLKYAFDNNWIGPGTRVILGVVAGLVMLGLGHWWRNRYPIMTRVLTGGGVAVMYLAVFSSFAIYDLVPMAAAVVMLLAISVLCAVMAVRYDSMSLAVLGILGAFFAPFLLGGFGSRSTGESGTGQAVQLLVYIIIVDLGVLALSALRNWRWFTLLALVCSLITYAVWYNEFEYAITTGLAELGITLIFIVFLGATGIFHLLRRHSLEAFDFPMMAINAIAYTAISLSVMWDDYRAWMGGFMVLIAVVYGLLAWLAHRTQATSTRLQNFSLGIALILFTVAIPVQFGDRAATAIAWAVEGSVLVWLSFRERIPEFRYFGYLIFLAVTVRLCGFDSRYDPAAYTAVFNERFLAFIIAIAFTWVTAVLLWRQRQTDDRLVPDYQAFIGLATLLTLWVTGFELYGYRDHAIETASPNLLVLLVPVAGMLLNTVFWKRKTELSDSIYLLVSNICLVIFTGFLWDILWGWMGLTYLLLAGLNGAVAWKVISQREADALPGVLSLVIGLALFTAAAPLQMGDSAWLPVAWAAEAVLLVYFAGNRNIPLMRYFGYLVLLILLWRLAIYDSTISNIASFQPVINERFAAFLAGIAALYLVLYLLYRKRDTIPEAPSMMALLAIGASMFSIWLISVEVWDTFSASIATTSDMAARDGMKNAQNLSLTAIWAFYAAAALCLGIWRKWRYVRLGALVLLVVPIVKVFVYDVFKLDMGYRIGAFVGLGLLLLSSAYVYQRFGAAIKGALTGK